MAIEPVTAALQTLASLAAEEIQLLCGVREAFDELRDDLNSMKSLLQDADNSQSKNNQRFKTWIKQVREVAFDAEDVFDEFFFRMSLPGSQGLVCSLHSFFTFMLNVRAQHQLAVQVRAIKLRTAAISKRRETYLSLRLEEASSSNSTAQEAYDPRQASLYIDEADVVGIENPRRTLTEWLIQGTEKLTSISVVGMGGIGKTTLVKKVYDSEIVRKWFDSQSWVRVSNSFSSLELLQATLNGFMEETKHPVFKEVESMREYQLIDALRNYLQKKRYVIVFDDIWSIDAWEAVKFALYHCKSGSRIIFTTRLIEVAACMETTGHVYHLEPLPEKEAWNLFCMKTFNREYGGICPDELKSLSHSILKKCGGLPLAIVAIGGLLSRKNKVVFEWRKVLQSLAEEITGDGKLNNLERILLLSYNDLPHYLKSCYLYMSAFPEDYTIQRMRIVRLWVAEKFVEEKPGLSMEEVAESYLNELVNRSLVQVVKMDYLNRVLTCRLHDIMREILVLKSREELLITVITQSNRIKNENVRRVSIHDNIGIMSPSPDKRFAKLRSVLAFKSMGSSSGVSNDSISFQGFRLSRVVHLENEPLVRFPLSLLKLVLLRYLSLRKTKITEIPDSIRQLKNLEILDVKYSPVSNLPLGILELKHLQQIRGYYYSFSPSFLFANTHGMSVPRGIEKLTSLQKLGSVEVGENGTLVKELGKLTQLRRLGILKLKEEHSADFCYTLEKLKHMTSLYVISMNATDVLQLNREIRPPDLLMHLYLKCGLPSLPKWISSHPHLTKLVLQNSELKQDPLQALQALPSLVILELLGAYNGEQMCCNAKKGYPRLKKLGVHMMKNLGVMKMAEGAMPELRELHITTCGKLATVPFGIEHLRNLERLQLWGLSSALYQKIERSGGEDFWKIQHIPRSHNF